MARQTPVYVRSLGDPVISVARPGGPVVPVGKYFSTSGYVNFSNPLGEVSTIIPFSDNSDARSGGGMVLSGDHIIVPSDGIYAITARIDVDSRQLDAAKVDIPDDYLALEVIPEYWNEGVGWIPSGDPNYQFIPNFSHYFEVVDGFGDRYHYYRGSVLAHFISDMIAGTQIGCYLNKVNFWQGDPHPGDYGNFQWTGGEFSAYRVADSFTGSGG